MKIYRLWWCVLSSVALFCSTKVGSQSIDLPVHVIIKGPTVTLTDWKILIKLRHVFSSLLLSPIITCPYNSLAGHCMPFVLHNLSQ